MFALRIWVGGILPRGSDFWHGGKIFILSCEATGHFRIVVFSFYHFSLLQWAVFNLFSYLRGGQFFKVFLRSCLIHSYLFILRAAQIIALEIILRLLVSVNFVSLVLHYNFSLAYKQINVIGYVRKITRFLRYCYLVLYKINHKSNPV